MVTFLESVDRLGNGLSLTTDMLALYIREQGIAVMDERISGGVIDFNKEQQLIGVANLMNELIRLQKNTKNIGQARK